MRPLIEIKNLKHGVLDISSLEIPAGITAISGKNGSGKTTLLKICSGLVLSKNGSVLIDGKTPRETDIGYVSEFPNRHLLFSILFDEIASPLRFEKKPVEEIKKQVREVAELFGISHLLKRECTTLSGGEKILAGICSAVVMHPQVLVLDEPDSHLDFETTQEIFEKISVCKIPYVLWSTHSDFVKSSADTEVRL
ncbi:MAG: energy-coupling factor ABC transporter ATP-binding protein [Methanocorpusculum sp.]|nr:energy-coupling factor ABC transporter ATP-binding protein [Methanocorpusculum sp.]